MKKKRMWSAPSPLSVLSKYPRKYPVARAAVTLGSYPHCSYTSSGSRSQRSRQSNPAFSPLSASDCFDQAAQVTVPESKTTFQVYYTPPKLADGTVIVCHHGAGYSALTFACFAKHVSIASQRECGVLSFDCRGHGQSLVRL